MPRCLRLAALVVAMVAIGCDDERPTAAPGGTGGGAGTAGCGGGAADGGFSRPDTPRLPPADLTVDLPFGGATEEIELVIDVRPALLDVHLSIDTTGSFGGEIRELQRTLTTEVVGALLERADDVGFGVSRMEDFPVSPFGFPSDRPFRLLSPIRSEASAIESALARLEPLGAGADLPEAGFETLYQIATGAGFSLSGERIVAPYAGDGAGGVGFRSASLRIVVHATDAPAHPASDYASRFSGAHSETEAIAALNAVEARVIGISSGESARADLERLALATGAVASPSGGSCATGIEGSARPAVGGRCPLVFDIGADGSGLSTALVEAIARLLDSEVYERVEGRWGGDRLGFVQVVEAAGATVPTGSSAPRLLDLDPVDGVEETFEGVVAGATLRFVARFRNLTLPALDHDQVFRVPIEVFGDGVLLARRVVRVRVPAVLPEGGPPAPTAPRDGGAGDGGPTPL